MDGHADTRDRDQGPGRSALNGWLRDGLKLLAFSVVTFAIYWLFRDEVAAGVAQLDRWADSPWAILVCAVVFLLGSIFLVPQWALIAAAVAAFGLLQGGILSWISTVIAAQLQLGFATIFRDRLGPRFSGPRRDRLKAMFGRNSFQSGLIVRLIPTGPFVMVNLAAGLAGVRPIPFIVGTMIGIVPKIVLTALVAQGLLSSADGQRIGLWLTVAGLAAFAAWLLNRTLKRRRRAALRAQSGK